MPPTQQKCTRGRGRSACHCSERHSAGTGQSPCACRRSPCRAPGARPPRRRARRGRARRASARAADLLVEAVLADVHAVVDPPRSSVVQSPCRARRAPGRPRSWRPPGRPCAPAARFFSRMIRGSSWTSSMRVEARGLRARAQSRPAAVVLTIALVKPRSCNSLRRRRASCRCPPPSSEQSPHTRPAVCRRPAAGTRSPRRGGRAGRARC